MKTDMKKVSSNYANEEFFQTLILVNGESKLIAGYSLDGVISVEELKGYFILSNKTISPIFQRTYYHTITPLTIVDELLRFDRREAHGFIIEDPNMSFNTIVNKYNESVKGTHSPKIDSYTIFS